MIISENTPTPRTAVHGEHVPWALRSLPESGSHIMGAGLMLTITSFMTITFVLLLQTMAIQRDFLHGARP